MASEVKTDINIVNGAAIASIELSLSAQDFDIVKRVGPLTVEFGGTFAYNSETRTIPANAQQIVNQVVKVTHKFSEEPTPAENEAMGLAWLASCTANVQAAAGALRTADSNLVGGQPTYTAI